MPPMSIPPNASVHPPNDGAPRGLGTAALAQKRAGEVQVYANEESRYRRRSWWLGLARLAVFASIVFFLIQSTRASPAIVYQRALPAALLFALVVHLHVWVRHREERARRQRILAAESGARMRGAQGPGARGALPVRPVSQLDAGRAGLHDEGRAHVIDDWVLEDLGIDGAAPSLYQLLNTTQSVLAARRLRVLLRTPLLEANAIAARQHALSELMSDDALRDALMLAFFAGRDRSVRRVPGFLSRSPDFPQGAFRVVLGFCGALVVPLVALSASDAGLWPLAGTAFLSTFVMSLRLRRRAGPIRESYLELEPLLRSVLDVARTLEASQFESALLRAHAERFRTALHGDHSLPAFLRVLRLLHLHEIGFLYGIVELLTSWDLHWLMALESRARRAPGQLQSFIQAASDLEALVALAVFGAEQAAVRFPEVFEGTAPHLEIRAGEHPLLPTGRVVANDVGLGGAARLAIVTGSNMSGKSTFLRMVALNVVLAQIGAPVRAAHLRLTPVRLHANINVHDSLADGKSYFLVEVERVQSILEAAQRDPFVLALFDELFRGTNSTERLASSREIARFLATTGGLFLLATHELELTRLVFHESVEGVVALHFRDEIRDGRMVFPYRVTSGVGTSHNALRLLELSGYPPEIVEPARRHAQQHRPHPRNGA